MVYDGNIAKKAPIAAIFVFAALFHLAAAASRFPDLAALLPPGLAEALIPLFFALLMCQGLLVARHEGDVQKLSWVAKASFALAFVYLSLLVLQTWDISIGPVDPSPPEEWPLGQRGMWFGVMSVGMFFPNYLAAAAILIPALRVITAPFRALPLLPAMLLLTAVGAGLGYGAMLLLSSGEVAGQISAVQEVISEDPGTAIGVIFAMVWVPILFGWLKDRKGSG